MNPKMHDNKTWRDSQVFRSNLQLTKVVSQHRSLHYIVHFYVNISNEIADQYSSE